MEQCPVYGYHSLALTKTGGAAIDRHESLFRYGLGRLGAELFNSGQDTFSGDVPAGTLQLGG